MAGELDMNKEMPRPVLYQTGHFVEYNDFASVDDGDRRLKKKEFVYYNLLLLKDIGKTYVYCLNVMADKYSDAFKIQLILYVIDNIEVY
ncbi:MAG TPA: hypothetical protein GXX75_19540 [Clostridiales bacterium]|nr:hypothetical protein [Clostridiales bacterium]